jgi:hypothetical protein
MIRMKDNHDQMEIIGSSRLNLLQWGIDWRMMKGNGLRKCGRLE